MSCKELAIVLATVALSLPTTAYASCTGNACSFVTIKETDFGPKEDQRLKADFVNNHKKWIIKFSYCLRNDGATCREGPSYNLQAGAAQHVLLDKVTPKHKLEPVSAVFIGGVDYPCGNDTTCDPTKAQRQGTSQQQVGGQAGRSGADKPPCTGDQTACSILKINQQGINAASGAHIVIEFTHQASPGEPQAINMLLYLASQKSDCSGSPRETNANVSEGASGARSIDGYLCKLRATWQRR